MKTYDKPIILDSGFICYVDNTKPGQFVILNITDIQNVINNPSDKFTFSPKHSNRYEDIINGLVSYKQPIVNSETFDVSVKNYALMHNSLPRDLLKLFKFRILENYPKDFWVNN
jgi:hypothetical protein